MFPVELIRQLAIVLRRGNDIRRELAHAILATLLSKDPSAGLASHQAALLLSGTWHEVDPFRVPLPEPFPIFPSVCMPVSFNFPSS